MSKIKNADLAVRTKIQTIEEEETSRNSLKFLHSSKQHSLPTIKPRSTSLLTKSANSRNQAGRYSNIALLTAGSVKQNLS
jgi:hypothetical protein